VGKRNKIGLVCGEFDHEGIHLLFSSYSDHFSIVFLSFFFSLGLGYLVLFLLLIRSDRSGYWIL
jgi:hypothetical protein